MSELENKLNELLENPVELEKLTRLASSLMAGGTPSAASEPQSEGGQEPGLEPKLLGALSRVMGRAKGEPTSGGRAVLEAMRPYVTEKRREKLDKALQIAKMAKLARLAFAEFGSDLHV